MVKDRAVDTKLTGSETAKDAFEKLSKAYDHSTVVQMLNRGEYDVLYRKSRQEVTSERQKAERRRIKALEAEFVRLGGKLDDINSGKIKA